MKAKLIFFLLLSVVCVTLYPVQLAGIISQKQWDILPPLFGDDSHKTLRSYFKNAQSIRFVIYNIDKLTYKAKFPDFAEIGTITYEKKEEKYYNLRIMNQINPLFFNGSWKFTISPSNEEERLTLMNTSGKDTFSEENDWGIFILSDRDFMKKFHYYLAHNFLD